MSQKVKPKKKEIFCDPAVCDHCMYICEGDFICDKKRPEPVMVVCEWDPTGDYLWCKKRRNRRAERRLIDAMNTVTKVSKKVQPLLGTGSSTRELYDTILGCLAEAPTVDAVEVEKYNNLREAFVDYACSGSPSPAPWCKNRNGMCVNGWGHCLPESGNCQGFNPDGEGMQDA